MDELSQSQDQTQSTTSNSIPLPDIKQNTDAIANAREHVDSLVVDIKGQHEAATASGASIEKVRLTAENARAEIDAQVAAMKESVGTLNMHAESSKATIAELTTLLASVQATNSQAKDTSTQATAALETLRTLANTAAESAGRIEALKTQVEQGAQVAAQRSQHIEDGRVYVDTKRAEIDVILNTAQKSASDAEAQHQASRATSGNLSSLYAAAQTTKANTDSTAEAINRLRQQCEGHSATAKKLADIAELTEKKVKGYEARLVELELQSGELLKTIKDLLPSATSAGLASAFLERRNHFKWPQRIWQGVFVLCLLVLFAIAGLHTGPNGLEYGLLPKADAALTFEHLGLSILYRLPFALPLLWLAFHASHKAAVSQRVEEDYAFKETVSRSFEGYRREMAELEGKAAPHSALSRYCTGVLGVITNPPGRIYEKHELNKTPLGALAETATPVAEAVSKVKPLSSMN